MPTLARWRSAWNGLGVARPDDRLYDEIVTRYSEPHRAYHTIQHLDECFARLDEARSGAERIHEVELALWFHDAVYQVRTHNNEEESAALARSAVAAHGLPDAIGGSVHDLVMATKHEAAPVTCDAALIADIDLSILGAPADRFDEYERQVREEYSWVPGFIFRRKRREILESFLARPHVFQTEHFQTSLEAAARSNLARSIERLRG